MGGAVAGIESVTLPGIPEPHLLVLITCLLHRFQPACVIIRHIYDQSVKASL